MSEKLRKEILDRIEEVLEAMPGGKDPTGESAARLYDILEEYGITLTDYVEKKE